MFLSQMCSFAFASAFETHPFLFYWSPAMDMYITLKKERAYMG